MIKIYISGGPGSGKTTYAKKLAKHLNIPCFDLDNVKWINDEKHFNERRSKKERAVLLNNILCNNKNWICEGVYFQDWIIPVIEKADKIIILRPSSAVRQYRIIRRSFMRMMHLVPKKHKENLITLFQLLKWSWDYEDKYLPLLIERIKYFKKPYKILGKRD